MKTIVIDDNTDYAEALAEDIGDDSESLLSGEGPSTLDEAEDALENKIDAIQDDGGSETPQVLINREMKLQGRKRQEALGQSLYQRVTWKHPEVRFRMYSFRSLETEVPCTQLPFAAGDLPEPPEEERLEEKERACLAHMDEEFEKVQHGFEKVSPTLVNLVRLINGAIRAGKIKPDGQVGKLLTLFGSLDLDDELEEVVYSFLDCAEQRARLIGQDSTASDSPPRQRQVVVVDDEVVGEGPLEGESLWTAVLDILFEKEGFQFSTCLPSEVQQDPRRLQDKDLVLMDIDFSQDADYDGSHPEFGGRKLLRDVNEVLPHLPVVMLSSYDEGGLYEECMNRGAYGYLTKDWGSYAKFRTDESEEEWFRGWQRAIEVPLNYKPFFQDTRLLRALGVVSDSGVESLRTALKDVELPTIESTQTLATFFEEFVNGYLYYREEVPQQSLSDCLQNEVFQGGGLPTGQILRILRNNVVHAPSFMNPEVDTWLYLLLLRAFMLRLLRPASVESTSWMDVLRDKLADELADSKALSREEAVYDGTFFSNSDGDLSDINESFIDERNKRIDHLVTRRELSADEFRYHVDGLINCLAAIFPRADLRQNLHELGNLPEDKVDKTLKEICKRSQTNGRYKRGFERLAPIDWVLDANLRATLFDSTGEKYEATLRWALAVRCWLWYFDRLLADSNSLLFESTVEEGQTRGIVENDVYANPDGRLINLFQEQGQAQYISYYGLRIGLYKISKCILERKGAIEDEVSDIRTRRENIQSSLQTLQSDLSSKQSRMSAIQSDLSDLDGRIQKRSANFKGGRDTGKMLQELRERKQGLVDDKEPLKEDIEDLEENISELEPELESVMRRENERRDVLQNIEDQGTNPEIFPDQTEALERSIRRKMTSMATLDVFQNVDDSFDTNTWIESVHEADSHAEVRRCIKRLEAVLP